MSLMQLMLDLEEAAGPSSAAASDEPTLPAVAKPAGLAQPQDAPLPQPQAGEPALFVATTLEAWDTDEPHIYARDVTLDGVCYRRLDPEYYAWLRHRMTMARAAAEAGKLPGPAFTRLRAAFNAVHTWATDHMGEQVLAAAVAELDAKQCRPPVALPPEPDLPEPPARHVPSSPAGHCFPQDGGWPHFHEVTDDAVARVDAIRDQALALGWTEARLYQNRGRLRFPYGQDYGLVCCLGRDEQLGEVTCEWIALHKPNGSALRFYRCDACPQVPPVTSRSAPVGNK